MIVTIEVGSQCLLCSRWEVVVIFFPANFFFLNKSLENLSPLTDKKMESMAFMLDYPSLRVYNCIIC